MKTDSIIIKNAHSNNLKHVDVELPEPLPDVKPSEGSSGGFDVTVKDWGKPEDIDMEM